MNIVLQIFTLLGALGMFLYGMSLMSESLQKAAGDKLRSFLASMTSTPFKQVLTGTAITTLVQSSSATTVMVVSFVNAGLITLANAVGVIMGANVGTIPTVWITAFGFSMDIAVISVPLMAVGFVLVSSKRTQSKNIGGFIIGFAMLFLGLSFMKSSAGDLLSDKNAMMEFFGHFTGYGFGSVLIFLLIGAVLTMLLQASSATMAITMLLATTGLINFDLAAAMVLGENIGTTITANMAASVGNASAKRAALAHSFYNIFGAIWVLILYRPFLKLVGLTVTACGLPDPLTADLSNPEPAAQNSLLFSIAILHTLFKLINTLILVWFIPQIVKFVEWVIKAPKDETETFRLKYISGGPLSTAELSLREAQQEIIHFGEICRTDYKYIREAILEPDAGKFKGINEKLVKYEEITDRIEYEIASYLNEVSKADISGDTVERIKKMYKIIGEMESLGDSGEAIGRMLKRMFDHDKKFTASMVEDLKDMLDTVQAAYDVMMINITKEHVTEINNALDAENRINNCRNSIREKVAISLEGNDYNYLTGVYFMDIVSELEQIGDFIINISQACQPNK